MAGPHVLFVNHVATMSGAEFVLHDVAAAFPGSSAFLFETGPLAQALAERGLIVTTSRHGAALSGIRRNSSALAAAPAALRMAGLVMDIASAARRHDVIYANSQKAFLLSALASAIARRPLIWHLHDIIDERHFGKTQRRLQVTLANGRARMVIVPSQAAADAFIAAGGKPGLVKIVPNGVEDRTDGPVPDRASLGLPEGPLAGIFSRLARWKGQHVAIEALSDLPGLQLAIAGNAMFGEEEYEAELRALVVERGFEDRVQFLGRRNDVMDLMQAVDLVIHPSVDPEPFGLTLVEAMFAGTPIVASDAGAAGEIITDGETGYLFSAGNPLCLAASVVRALLPEGRSVVEPARRRAVEHYGVERMRQSIAGLVGSLA